MNVVLITQNEPFYLSENINYLLNKLDDSVNIVGCVLLEASPFGERKNFIQKIKSTISTFGVSFFARYSWKFFLSKFFGNSPREVLERHKVPIISLQKNINHADSIRVIKNYAPDLLVSIQGNQIFKKDIINLATNGCINLHTSKLPKYRGLMPTFWVLRNGETKTAVSVFFVDEGIDSGPIIIQREINIGDKSQAQLIQYSKKIGMDAVVDAVQAIRNNSLNLLPNPDEEMSYFSFPTKEDVKEFKRMGKKFF